ncbi:hypothetical protein A2690_01190 [Candidatus Roizmanbacteria bacterium RIFCSPHIGHO2_01_FULL_39_12b]|uniref:Uncharacterized protein n=1 Tax=Candidatus Roizmanbacteria bacterium RIFCSPHIGHO2_01_FULL_39_12b TaxID=1802030 RepID=A0A1F7G9D5_9BACT|nr:MAG: hypothetical protein A2690_01190 [Candidatus Roizmanbacteria bacterium RIFCSPHIGHO2_01_FULL_39_12b]OGK45979.1 MAG: hypothetical protein A3B46_00955 [Candidatus Roizmanbacteria bacterium RIFCSPLOWO2_01_FULL_39_19]
MSLELLHAIVLASTLGLSYVISQSFLRPYDLQITAILFIIYFILKRKTQLTKHKYDLLDGAMFTFVVANIILSTNGIDSPFFFLCYFLLFTLAMLLEPTISLFAAISIIAIILIDQPLGSFNQVIKLLSLPLMTPFSMMLGQEYEKNQQLRKKNEELEHVREELETIIEN